MRTRRLLKTGMFMNKLEYWFSGMAVILSVLSVVISMEGRDVILHPEQHVSMGPHAIKLAMRGSHPTFYNLMHSKGFGKLER